MKVTLKQIADIVGVSRGTVDRALHGRSGVNPQVRDQILTVAAELGYRPNAAGRQLSSLKTRLRFGVILPRSTGGFWDEVYRGLDAAAAELEDYGVTILRREFEGFQPKEQLPLIRELLEEKVDGLALVPVNDSAIAAELGAAAEAGLPVVTFNTEIENVSPLCYIGSEYETSGRTAAGLMHLFFRERPIRLLMLTGSRNMLSHTTRCSSFLRELARQHADFELLQTCRVYAPNEVPSSELAYELVGSVLKKHPEINAIFTSAGSVQAVSRAIHDAGLSGQIIHISFDRNISTIPALENGSLTAVIDQDGFQQGYQPIRILFDRIVHGMTPSSPRIIVPNAIFIGQNAAF